MKVSKILFIILLFIGSCTLKTPSSSADKNIQESSIWTLVSSNVEQSDYFQMRIRDNHVEILTPIGEVLNGEINTSRDSLFIEKIIGFSVTFHDDYDLHIENEKYKHELRIIKSYAQCFCVDIDYQFLKFNYEINQITPDDSIKLDSMKNELLHYFSGDLITEKTLDNELDIIIE